MPKVEDLLPLVAEPMETLSVEHKSWLDLSDTADKARLAKAIIAMANHGGVRRGNQGDLIQIAAL